MLSPDEEGREQVLNRLERLLQQVNAEHLDQNLGIALSVVEQVHHLKDTLISTLEIEYELDELPGFVSVESLSNAIHLMLAEGDAQPVRTNFNRVGTLSSEQFEQFQLLFSLNREDGRTVSIAYLAAVLEWFSASQEQPIVEETEGENEVTPERRQAAEETPAPEEQERVEDPPAEIPKMESEDDEEGKSEEGIEDLRPQFSSGRRNALISSPGGSLISSTKRSGKERLETPREEGEDEEDKKSEVNPTFGD